ncbi:MAG TPA: LPS export ABC transporter permease LptG [Xanthobacteraceae bacterium]|nr:LPS export ABC transporter permease LptG [Xanthobacteraceae bacterium]
MMTGTLARYFGLHFLGSVLAVFLGIFALIVLFDYIELMRRHYHVANLSSLLALKTSLHRAPLVVERILPFCILTGAMSCYLNLSRRHELVVARAAGISAWQFIMPALAASFVLGLIATMAYNPLAATMFERSKDLEAELSGARPRDTATTGGRFWVRQQSGEGHSILNAATSREQGVALDTVTAFTFDAGGRFLERIEAKSARLEDGHWQLQDARVYSQNGPMRSYDSYQLRTSLSPEQVRESFSTPETVPFWQLPLYIRLAEGVGLAAAGYRLQYQKLLAQPFMLAAMVLLAAAFSLRFFRFGGVPKMVLGGVAAGFLVYVMAKVTNDLGTAELLYPLIAAWLPVLFGGLIGLLALLYMEDG